MSSIQASQYNQVAFQGEHKKSSQVKKAVKDGLLAGGAVTALSTLALVEDSFENNQVIKNSKVKNVATSVHHFLIKHKIIDVSINASVGKNTISTLTKSLKVAGLAMLASLGARAAIKYLNSEDKK